MREIVIMKCTCGETPILNLGDDGISFICPNCFKRSKGIDTAPGLFFAEMDALGTWNRMILEERGYVEADS